MFDIKDDSSFESSFHIPDSMFLLAPLSYTEGEFYFSLLLVISRSYSFLDREMIRYESLVEQRALFHCIYKMC